VSKNIQNGHHTKAVLFAMNCLENDYTPVTSFGCEVVFIFSLKIFLFIIYIYIQLIKIYKYEMYNPKLNNAIKLLHFTV
jgi:hypothetical protein